MKKKMVISAVSVFVLALATYLVLANTYFSPYETQLRLAYKYLDEGNYTEAILAFDKAIEIDAKKPKAYIGKAEVYIIRFDEDAIADASAVLKLGYDQSESNRTEIVNAIIKLSDMLKNNGKEQLAYEFSKIMYDLIADEKIADWMVDYIRDYAKNPGYSDGKFFIDTFKEIYQTTGSDNLFDWLKDFATDIFDEDDFKFKSEIFDLLDFMYEETEDEEILEIKDSNYSMYLQGLLKEVYEKYMSGDKWIFKDFMIHDVINIDFSRIDEDCVFYSDSGNLTDKGTNGIALFKKSRLLYIGEWENGKLNGNGECAHVFELTPETTTNAYVSSISLKHIEGTFKNGIPNGYCTELQDTLGQPLEKTGYSGRPTFIYKGNYDMSVLNGSFEYIWSNHVPSDYYSQAKNKSFSYETAKIIGGDISRHDTLYINGVAQNHSTPYTGEIKKAFLMDWE